MRYGGERRFLHIHLGFVIQNVRHMILEFLNAAPEDLYSE